VAFVIPSVARNQVAVVLSRIAAGEWQGHTATQYSVLQCDFFSTHLIPRYARNDKGHFGPAVGHLLTACSTQDDGVGALGRYLYL
jgi:hypothetical protein